MTSNGTIDLRSDTVTRPGPEMRRAMAEAEVGDDVFGEDPTVARLQERAAELFGMDAGLYVTSGTMGNQVAAKSLTQAGDEIILEASAHMFMYESAGLAAISGVQTRTLQGDRGILSPEAIRETIRPPGDSHYPPTTLICLENTHNLGGGKIYPLDLIQAIRAVADEYGVHMHLDGARVLNACAATGISPATYAQHFDSISCCLSKGLGAPVGSIVVGSCDFIERAHRFRKMLGGGMRQAGIIAAGGLYALEHNVARLKEDGDNARRLAEGLAEIEGIRINPEEVETNIIFFGVDEEVIPQKAFGERLRDRGLLVESEHFDRVRVVTHLDVMRDDMEAALEIVGNVLEEARG